jgi:CheY-like chemotaxis protein
MGSKILLADDSITIQKVVNLTFADEGIEVVTVSNGDMAERRMQEINPDLVLADIFMPGKNGYELCQFIKESPQFRNVPVVLLVGAFEPFDQSEARRVHADAHLTKPFESRALVETVRKLIQTSQASQASSPQEYRRPPDTRPLEMPAPEPTAFQSPIAETVTPMGAGNGHLRPVEPISAILTGPAESAGQVSVDYNRAWQPEGSIRVDNSQPLEDSLGETDQLSSEPLQTSSAADYDLPVLDYPLSDGPFELTDGESQAAHGQGLSEEPVESDLSSIQYQDFGDQSFQVPDPAAGNQPISDVYFSTGDDASSKAGRGSISESESYGWEIPTDLSIVGDSSPSHGAFEFLDEGAAKPGRQPEPARESYPLQDSQPMFSNAPAVEEAVNFEGDRGQGVDRWTNPPTEPESLPALLDTIEASAESIAEDEPLGDVFSDIDSGIDTDVPSDVHSDMGQPTVEAYIQPVYAHPYVPAAVAAEPVESDGALQPHPAFDQQAHVVGTETEGGPAIQDSAALTGQNDAVVEHRDHTVPLNAPSHETQVAFELTESQPAEAAPLERELSQQSDASVSEWENTYDQGDGSNGTFTSSEMWVQPEAQFSAVEVDFTPPATDPQGFAIVTNPPFAAEVVTDPPFVAEAVTIPPLAAEPETGFEIAPEPSLESGFDIVQESALSGTIRSDSRAKPEASQLAEQLERDPNSLSQSQGVITQLAIDEIVRRVVEQMSDSVVREIAWEVVPDCVERIVEKMTREGITKGT